MSNDLVRRLRGPRSEMLRRDPLLIEASDRIVVLERELGAVKADKHDAKTLCVYAERTITALKAKLAEINAVCESVISGKGPSAYRGIESIAAIAATGEE